MSASPVSQSTCALVQAYVHAVPLTTQQLQARLARLQAQLNAQQQQGDEYRMTTASPAPNQHAAQQPRTGRLQPPQPASSSAVTPAPKQTSLAHILQLVRQRQQLQKQQRERQQQQHCHAHIGQRPEPSAALLRAPSNLSQLGSVADAAEALVTLQQGVACEQTEALVPLQAGALRVQGEQHTATGSNAEHPHMQPGVHVSGGPYQAAAAAACAPDKCAGKQPGGRKRGMHTSTEQASAAYATGRPWKQARIESQHASMMEGHSVWHKPGKGYTGKQEVADLLNKVVEIPGHIFDADVPGVYFRARVIEPDKQHAKAVVIRMVDDKSRWYFPSGQVREWLRDMDARHAAQVLSAAASPTHTAQPLSQQCGNEAAVAEVLAQMSAPGRAQTSSRAAPGGDRRYSFRAAWHGEASSEMQLAAGA